MWLMFRRFSQAHCLERARPLCPDSTTSLGMDVAITYRPSRACQLARSHHLLDDPEKTVGVGPKT